jgi:hypothetical protein
MQDFRIEQIPHQFSSLASIVVTKYEKYQDVKLVEISS